MTAKEFYDYMKSQGMENIDVRVKYRDGGGEYYGYDDLGSEEDYGIYHDEKNNVVYI